ncbi:hypothetical protein PAXRUDRAFT_156936, partial [Paxillus rubicundulus Ve08.2h10]
KLMPKSKKVITFIVNAMAASKLKKLLEFKHLLLSASFKFHDGSDKPWDTLQAQLLAKISQPLTPNMINFNDYNVSFYIPCVLPKPGLPLSCEENFENLSSQVEKSTGVH